jgi:hypothetical protein
MAGVDIVYVLGDTLVPVETLLMEVERFGAVCCVWKNYGFCG